MHRYKTYFNWSSGKDSALAFYYLQQDHNYNVEYLLTSVNASFDRVSMHGLRRELLQQQIDEIGLPFGTIELPEMPTNDIYENLVGAKVQVLKQSGYEYAAFGDIFLEDLRLYRENQLAKIGIKTVFPLWKRDTRMLINDFLSKGFKAITICVNSQLLDESFVGRIIDQDFINSLPENVDPCGENGEFHTFCYDGPIFENAVKFVIGEKVKRQYPGETPTSFWFCDLKAVG